MSRSRAPLRVVGLPAPLERAAPAGPLVWMLGVGAFGLAWSITTTAAYLPAVLGRFTGSATLIGLVLAAEGGVAILLPLLVGPLSDATSTPLGRRRPYMLFAIVPMAVTLGLLAFMSSIWTMALLLLAFFVAYYIYEPTYRGLYPDKLPSDQFGRAQGVQHIFRGAAIGGALVLGGFLLAVWMPFPFLVAAVVTALTCGAVIVLVREDGAGGPKQYERVRTLLAAPWRVVRTQRNVRRFLVANTAWEATFAGMRTFIVLYIIQGLDQPLRVSSVVLAIVAGGYVSAAAVASRFGDRLGLARVILGASVVYGAGLLVPAFVTEWRTWYYALVYPFAFAGGTVMTLAWGLLFKLMPASDRGTVTGLATTTKGVGLILGPLAVGAAIDIFEPLLGATEGFAAMWPAVAIPILAVIPIVALLADAESEARGRETAPGA